MASTAATFNPMALRISSTKGVVFDDPTATGGTPAGTGSIPAEGAGTRFMWYPGKAALRAGYVDGSQWDDGNIGNYSTAIGYNTVASGWNSTAMGYGTTASKESSTAMGGYTTANGGLSTAMGFYTQASGGYSTAMGTWSTASGESATAMGNYAAASGMCSVAMGFGTGAHGNNAIAMGDETTAKGGNSTAMGSNTVANGFNSTAMGYNTIAKSAYEVAIGRFNTDYAPASITEWDAADRLLVIGNGTYDLPSDALVVLKNGNVGIGTSTPGYRLQLGTDSAAKPGTNTWTIASDARLKAIAGPYDRGLDEIAALQAVRYHYAVGNARGHDPAPEYVGFIAQQAQVLFPEAVSEGADGYLDFNMHAVNVAMVNAIRTLREQNQAQGDELQTLWEQNQAQLEHNQAQTDQLQMQGEQLQAVLEQNQTQESLMGDLRSENAALVQRLAQQEQRHAAQEQRLVTLEAENARLARLQADLTQLQAQLRVLQGQMAAAASHGQVALGR